MKTPMSKLIYIERENRARYKTLGKKLGKNFIHADIFALTMIYGYMNNVRIPLVHKEGLFRTTSAGSNFYSLIILLYINETDKFPKNSDDLSEAVHMAQEYANGGLEFLEEEVYNEMDNFFNKLASSILKFNYEHDFSDLLTELEIG